MTTMPGTTPVPRAEEAIKTMKLYHHLDRIQRRLAARGVHMDIAHAPRRPDPTITTPGPRDHADEAPPPPPQLDPELLGTMDCLHFFGDEPIARIQGLLGAMNPPSPGPTTTTTRRVLDLGTGYGGTARLLASRTPDCIVDALELQPDLSAVGQELTRRCGLEGRVRHLTGDFLAPAPTSPLAKEDQHGGYDVIVGLLSFLHIGRWDELFARCWDCLRPGGVLYVEDFVQRRADAPFTPEEHRKLREDIYCADLATPDELQRVITAAGLEIVSWDDVTDKWRPYVVTRSDNFNADYAQHVALDGEDAAAGLKHFYQSVADVFVGGRFGGYTLVARRPLASPLP